MAELLTVVTVLGIMATFTIPKVLTAQQQQKRTAVLKEAVSLISDINFEIAQNGVSATISTAFDYVPDYFRSHLNFVTICNETTESPCWTAAQQAVYNITSYDLNIGILPSGAAIDGPRNWFNQDEKVVIDWNGSSGPNQIGDDMLILVICGFYDPNNALTSKTCAIGSDNATVNAGMIGPSHGFWGDISASAASANISLYESLFK